MANQGRFRITANGFTVYHETWDHMLEVDGKRDEVFLRADVRVIDRAGATLFQSEPRTRVMGDINSDEFRRTRVQAGSASGLGGLRTGDTVPGTSTPWRRQGILHPDRLPLTLVELTLTEGESGVAVIPALWEWDGGTDLWNTWGNALAEHGPEIAGMMVDFIKGPSLSGTPRPGDFIRDAKSGLRAFMSLSRSILGEAKDRPIGMDQVNGSYVFTPKILTLTYERAVQLVNTDFGKGLGVLEFNFKDAGSLGDGNYSLYIQVERVDTSAPPQTATYGSTIRMQHALTGGALHSHLQTYGHRGTSGQQQVTAFFGYDDNDLWRIKGPDGQPENYRAGQPVQNGDIIRLEHVLTRRNLHSHYGAPSPVTRQQEVTCFGTAGIGDSNDNWRLEIDGGGVWNIGKRLRMIHTNTNHALHSHQGFSHPQWTMGQQEVTAFPDRDDNDYWFLTEA